MQYYKYSAQYTYIDTTGNNKSARIANK